MVVVVFPWLSLRSKPGLQLANAFGVTAITKLHHYRRSLYLEVPIWHLKNILRVILVRTTMEQSDETAQH